jgi:16S rRNA (adenine1518-N6/adenine1519-N6)-dimethyltransferase
MKGGSTMNLCDYDTIRELLGRHGFRFSKSMGQNFLIDPQVPCDIAAASGADQSRGVLEIGPGIGPLTAELAQRAGKVVSIELDKSLLPVLAETMAPYPNVEIVQGDVMKLDLNALAAEKFQGLRPIVCANLPYNITTPVLTKLIETPCFESVTVLIQKEVAQRLAAPQGSADGGAFSLFLQYYMETEYLFEVPREKFLPAPKVTSAVLRCVRRGRPAVEVADEAFFFRVIRGAFLLRRKTLSNSLAAALPELDKADIQKAIERGGLDSAVRGERLTLADFAQLSAALALQLGTN